MPRHSGPSGDDHVRIERPILKDSLNIGVEDVELGPYGGGYPMKQIGSGAPYSPLVQTSEEKKPATHPSMVSQGLADAEESVVRHWDRFTRKGKKSVGVGASLRAIVFSSWVNVLFVLLPISWVSHFLEWPQRATFALAWLAIIPLERLAEWGGDEMSFYLGKDLGDLLIVTLHNCVEAILALILLSRCELALLKSTIVGVVILHLLLVPGMAFISGGADIHHQDLHPHLTELNHSILALGVLSLMVPAAFFAAIRNNYDPTAVAESAEVSAGAVAAVVNDAVRGDILKMSRGIAFCLLYIYICSRVYLHHPPGDVQPEVSQAIKDHEARLEEEEPSINQYVCIVMLLVVLALTATTAEWLVESLEFVRTDDDVKIEFFGLILLPLVSYAADGTLTLGYHVRHRLRSIFREPPPPNTLAKGRAIDLSIQFTLFWMPFVVLVGWWSGRPMSLLFDFFEVAVLIGACFIVNYVTADSQTNWAEGATMVSFYVMIAVCAWFYPGQEEILAMSGCDSVAEAIVKVANGNVEGLTERWI